MEEAVMFISALEYFYHDEMNVIMKVNDLLS